MFPLTIADALARTPAVSRYRATGVFESPDPRDWEDRDVGRARATARKLMARLRAEGFTFLGSGHFSLVFQHVDWPGKVLKISVRHGARDGEYDAAVDYWQYCLANRGKLGKHLPVVYQTGRLMFAGEMVAYVWMKAYTKGDFSDRCKLSGDTDPRKYASYVDVDGESVGAKLAAMRRNNIDADSWFYILNDVKNYGALDFHADNMMYDPDLKTFVITDPIF